MIHFSNDNIELSKYLNTFISSENFSNIVVLTDNNTERFCLPIIKSTLDIINYKIHYINIPAGEKYKNISTCNKIWNEMLSHGFDRKTLLIALGGGVICDIAGFIATTYKRGIDYVLIPTSLLAQVDAAIGGKNGVNMNNVKNSIGTFGHPLHILINTIFLSTLPETEFICGLTEVVKYGIIANKKLLTWIDNQDYHEMIFKMIKDSVEIKNNIVNKDYNEKGLRKILNFGHTIGHAIESVSDYKVNHGEAVALGMITSLILSEKILGLKQETCTMYINIIRKYLLLPNPIYINIPEIVKSMRNDKKNIDGKIMMVLINYDQNVKINVPVSEKLIEKTLEFVYKICYQPQN